MRKPLPLTLPLSLLLLRLFLRRRRRSFLFMFFQSCSLIPSGGFFLKFCEGATYGAGCFCRLFLGAVCPRSVYHLSGSSPRSHHFSFSLKGNQFTSTSG